MKRATLMLAALAMVLDAAGNVKADLTEVTSRSSLGGTDYVDWGTLGENGTFVSNPFSVISNGGISLNVSKPESIDFLVLVQGNPNGWVGNFANGANLLDTGMSIGPNEVTVSDGPMTISSTQGLSAIGTQIQYDVNTSFTATITAYDSMNNVLGSFTENGVSHANGDNSAIVLGVTSTTNNIYSITYSVSNSEYPDLDFAINRLDLATASFTAPEPSGIALFGLGVVCLAIDYAARRRKLALAAA